MKLLVGITVMLIAYVNRQGGNLCSDLVVMGDLGHCLIPDGQPRNHVMLRGECVYVASHPMPEHICLQQQVPAGCDKKQQKRVVPRRRRQLKVCWRSCSFPLQARDTRLCGVMTHN